MQPTLRLTASDTVDPSSAGPLRSLLERAEATDGQASLNEAARLNLRRPRTGVTHLSAVQDGTVVGYAQLESGPAGSTGQVVVDPEHRRHGIGAALVEELRLRSRTPLQVWATGDTEAARALARRTGLAPVRTLLIMTRSLLDPLPAVRTPEGLMINTFRPGTDEQAWLAVNRRAFAHHPEQGAVSADDLAEREAEPWFDPAGFFLARATDDPDGRVLGFHWTKQQPGTLGEVYVIGVDPDAQGRGLAKALLLRGLEHLRDRGNTEVELYVEGDHTTAVGLYTAYGFAVTHRDVMYATPGPDTGAPVHVG